MTTSAKPEDQEVYGTNLHALRTGDGAPYPISGTDNGDGTLSLNVNANITGGASNTAAATNAGTTATTANPVQGVTGGVPIPISGVQNARTDHSSTIATGGTAQDVFTAGQATNGYYFQNLSAVAMYIRDDGTSASASSGSILIPANGGYYETGISIGAPTSKLSVFCTTAGSAFTCKAV